MGAVGGDHGEIYGFKGGRVRVVGRVPLLLRPGVRNRFPRKAGPLQLQLKWESCREDAAPEGRCGRYTVLEKATRRPGSWTEQSVRGVRDDEGDATIGEEVDVLHEGGAG